MIRGLFWPCKGSYWSISDQTLWCCLFLKIWCDWHELPLWLFKSLKRQFAFRPWCNVWIAWLHKRIGLTWRKKKDFILSCVWTCREVFLSVRNNRQTKVVQILPVFNWQWIKKHHKTKECFVERKCINYSTHHLIEQYYTWKFFVKNLQLDKDLLFVTFMDWTAYDQSKLCFPLGSCEVLCGVNQFFF